MATEECTYKDLDTGKFQQTLKDIQEVSVSQEAIMKLRAKVHKSLDLLKGMPYIAVS